MEHPSEVVQKGMEVEVMVLDVDSDNKRISLGIKQLQDDPWPDLVTRFTKGHEVDGRVARLQDKGVVMELEDGVEGFVPGSHAAAPADSLGDYFQAGDTVSLRVIASDASDRRIVLEVTSAPERRKAGEPEDAAGPDEDGVGGESAEAAPDESEVPAEEPVETADVEEAVAEEPETAADEPESSARDPESEVEEPEAAAEEDEGATEQAEVSAEEDEAPTEASEAAADEPEAAADEPEAAADEPEAAVPEVVDEEKDSSDE